MAGPESGVRVWGPCGRSPCNQPAVSFSSMLYVVSPSNRLSPSSLSPLWCCLPRRVLWLAVAPSPKPAEPCRPLRGRGTEKAVTKDFSST